MNSFISLQINHNFEEQILSEGSVNSKPPTCFDEHQEPFKVIYQYDGTIEVYRSKSMEKITNQINYLALFNLYRKHYHKKSEAIYYFLKFLKLNAWFYEMPTEKEVICLLKRYYHYSVEAISESLHVSRKTIEAHQYNISSKLLEHSINELFTHLFNMREEKLH